MKIGFASGKLGAKPQIQPQPKMKTLTIMNGATGIKKGKPTYK